MDEEFAQWLEEQDTGAEAQYVDPMEGEYGDDGGGDEDMGDYDSDDMGDAADDMALEADHAESTPEDYDEDSEDDQENNDDFNEEGDYSDPDKPVDPKQKNMEADNAQTPEPEQGGGEKGGGGGDAVDSIDKVSKMWQVAMKVPVTKPLCKMANNAIKSAASATLVGAVAWLFDDVIGTCLKLLSNDVVDIFSHTLHPFYTEGIKAKANKLVRKPMVQKVLTQINSKLQAFAKATGYKKVIKK